MNNIPIQACLSSASLREQLEGDRHSLAKINWAYYVVYFIRIVILMCVSASVLGCSRSDEAEFCRAVTESQESKMQPLTTKDTVSATQDKPKPLVIVQVRNEVHMPGRTASSRVDEYSSIVKDGWYHAVDGLFRVRIPILQSGKINVLRRRWENPDGIDVKFVDDEAHFSAVFSYEADSKAEQDKLKGQYSKYLSTQNTKHEVKVINTQFGSTVEVIAMNWVSTREYPYDQPTIDISKGKDPKIGSTVGIGWIFWRNDIQCGCWIIMPVDRKLDEAVAFEQSKQLVKKFAEGIEFRKVQ
jgi:hypothetical protein